MGTMLDNINPVVENVVKTIDVLYPSLLAIVHTTAFVEDVIHSNGLDYGEVILLDSNGVFVRADTGEELTLTRSYNVLDTLALNLIRADKVNEFTRESMELGVAYMKQDLRTVKADILAKADELMSFLPYGYDLTPDSNLSVTVRG